MLQLVQGHAIALQAQIHKAQAFVLGEACHFVNQSMLAFRGLCEGLAKGFTKLGYGLGGIEWIGWCRS